MAILFHLDWGYVWEQWERTLLLCSTSWHLLCLWTPKDHCNWVTPKGIFNYKNKGKIQIIMDKVEGVKTKQWELAASVSFPPSPTVLFLVFSVLCIHPAGYSLQSLYKRLSIVHLLYGSEWKRISTLYSSHCSPSVCSPNKDKCTTESA